MRLAREDHQNQRKMCKHHQTKIKPNQEPNQTKETNWDEGDRTFPVEHHRKEQHG